MVSGPGLNKNFYFLKKTIKIKGEEKKVLSRFKGPPQKRTLLFSHPISTKISENVSLD